MSHKKVWEFLVGWMMRFNSSLMIWLDSKLCSPQPLNQDVEVTSPQPQPIDDIAGMRAAPWGDSPPRAVHVVSRHRAIDLMP